MNASTQWKAADENIRSLHEKKAKEQQESNVVNAPTKGKHNSKPNKVKFDLDSNASCYLMVDTIDKGSGIGNRAAYVYLLGQLTARLSEKMPTLAIKTGGGRRSTLDDDPSGAASSMATVSQVSSSQL